MACFCLSWPCMHTRNSEIDGYIASIRSEIACSGIVDDREIALRRARITRFRDARVADQDQYYNAPWMPPMAKATAWGEKEIAEEKALAKEARKSKERRRRHKGKR